MKKTKDKTPEKQNRSADYYSEEVYETGPLYGIENLCSEEKDNDDQPIESWGWANNTD